MKSRYRAHELSPIWNLMWVLMMGGYALLCLAPLLLLLSASLTENRELLVHGYRFIPKKITLFAYQYILSTSNQLGRSYLVTIFVTVVGTSSALVITPMMAYSLFRLEGRYRKILSVFVLIPILFQGGIVPTYMVLTQIYHLKNSIWVLILPLLPNPFFVFVIRSFLVSMNIESIIEATKIDGAGELRTYLQIIFPLMIPVIGVFGLFTSFSYWNDWFRALLYINDSAKMPLQYLLVRIQHDLRFLYENADKMFGTAEELRKNLPAESSMLAMVVIAIGPIIFAYAFFQRYFIRGLTLGSLKA